MDGREEAMTIIRSMIESIVLTPRVDAGGLEAILRAISPAFWLCARPVLGVPNSKTPRRALALGGVKYRWLRGHATILNCC